MMKNHSLNNIKLILINWKRNGETTRDLITRVLDTESMIRELMNTISPSVGYSHLEKILNDPAFISGLEEEC